MQGDDGGGGGVGGKEQVRLQGEARLGDGDAGLRPGVAREQKKGEDEANYGRRPPRPPRTPKAQVMRQTPRTTTM
jgi:hypothetical protein